MFECVDLAMLESETSGRNEYAPLLSLATSRSLPTTLSHPVDYLPTADHGRRRRVDFRILVTLVVHRRRHSSRSRARRAGTMGLAILEILQRSQSNQ